MGHAKSDAARNIADIDTNPTTSPDFAFEDIWAENIIDEAEESASLMASHIVHKFTADLNSQISGPAASRKFEDTADGIIEAWDCVTYAPTEDEFRDNWDMLCREFSHQKRWLAGSPRSGSGVGAFLYDSDFASAVRILAAVGRVKFATDVLHPHTIAALTALLEANNHYVAKYRRAFEHLRQNPTDTVYLPVDLSLVVESSAYLRRYNLPTVNEVAAIVQALVGEDINSRCIALRLRNDIAVNSWDFIICMQPVYLPLRFVLLSPDGQSEWYPEMELQNDNNSGL
ncbi:MAG: hypothetical protein SEPTF4163_004853 [Sporothrix epigloea]